MRMSCNGCRVLRKGCAQDCTIRPCLQWIETADSQANVTLFLAKFYGRAGLLNLINAAEHHHRPFIFRSLLYEACGRIVNPIYGSVGLLWSGNWQLCQTAVEAVLKGAPVIQIPPETTDETANPIPMPLLKAFDIRHVSRDHKTQQVDLHKVKVANSTRTRFKRSSKRHVINNHDNSGNYKPPIFDVHGNDRRWMNLYETNKSTAIRSGQPIQTTTEDSKEDNVKLELTIGRCPISPPTDAVSHSTTVDRCIELSMSDYKRF